MSRMSSSVIFTFIRHAESTDNTKDLWSGWSNPPLTNHGTNQARALGKFFADTRFTTIHTSDLKRAFGTAQALYDAQKDPKPIFDSSELLREQNFGVAEGKPWTYSSSQSINIEEEMAKGVYPTFHGSDDKFPGGESINDLGQRAHRAITTLLLPHVWQAAKEGKSGVHVAVVGHGRSIGLTISGLLKMSANQANGTGNYRGMSNTAWTRLVIEIEGAQEGRPVDVDQQPLLVMRVTDVNCHSHTDNIIHQKGGIGSTAYDETQQDIRKAFFGGITEPLPDSDSDVRAHDKVTGEENIIE